MNNFEMRHKNMLSLTIMSVFVLFTSYILLAGSIQTHAQLQEVQNGDLIQTQGSNDVYLVKRTNTKAFKRLILNPMIFNAYPELHWENIKTVNQETFHSITTSDLITPNNSQATYRLFPAGDMGVKARIDLTKEQMQEAGIDPDSIFEVNDNEYSEMSYPSIDSITTIQQLRQGQLYTSNMQIMSISSIQDGDLIKEQNSNSIYIAKTTNNQRYKRKIVNPRIFQAYGHLRFQNVKTVSNQDILQFQTSHLVQEVYQDGTPVNTGIYKIFPFQGSGIKRLIQTNNLCNLPEQSIFSINSMEASEGFYQTGSPITQCQDVVSTPDETGVEIPTIPTVIEDEEQESTLPQITISLMVSSQTEIMVQWNSVVGATMYEVRHRRTGSNQWTTSTTNSSSSRIQTLTPNTNYEFQARALSNNQTGLWSIPRSATTSQNLVIPQVQQPTLSNVQQTSLTAIWTNIQNATSYDIRYKPALASIWTTLENQSSPAIINNLMPDATYQVQVRGTQGTLTGEYSSSAQARTQMSSGNMGQGSGSGPMPDPMPTPMLAQVTNVSATSTTNTTIAISWSSARQTQLLMRSGTKQVQPRIWLFSQTQQPAL